MKLFIIFLLMILILSIYINWNLLKKNEKLEDGILYYEDYIKKLNSFISNSNDKIKKLDENGIFETDGEVGFFLKMLKNIQEQLNNFKIYGDK